VRHLAARSPSVSLVAVCASAQYGLAATASGLPIASYASIAGWFHDPASIAGFYGGPTGVRDRLERASAAADLVLAGRDPGTVPAYAAGDDRAGTFIEMDYYANPRRGAVAEWSNAMSELTWAHWLTYDGLSPTAVAAGVPSLFVHADGCVFPDNVRAVARAVRGEVAWGEGEQSDFYDQPAQLAFAVDAVDEHLRRSSTTT
jgi:hypothetical protein